jgi:hypothetical protein
MTGKANYKQHLVLAHRTLLLLYYRASLASMALGREMGEAYRYPNLEFHTYYGSSLLYLSLSNQIHNFSHCDIQVSLTL